LAAAALAAQLWGEARRHLERAGAHDRPSARVCRLMAELEEAEHGDGAAARAWLARAADAAPDPAYVCRACNTQARDWTALCPNCSDFDTLRWSTPSVVAPPAAAPERLPVPVEAAGTKPVVPAEPASVPAGSGA
jgi:HemY protein